MRWSLLLCCLLLVGSISSALSEPERRSFVIDRCQLVPLPGHQVSFRIDGVEKTRWHYGREYPRPFFFPFNGPSGVSLTHMGHPGAGDHDHHRSIWFAFHKLGESALNFWGDGEGTQIRQKQWFAYKDGEEEAIMATALGYFDPDDREVMVQETVVAIRPMADRRWGLEFQLTLKPPPDEEEVVLGKTNFGILAVRVAKSISEHFGGGQLTNSMGERGESRIFGKPSWWMDYSGPVVAGSGPSRSVRTEGITYYDHPDNPRYPSKWHVRADGWMGASLCMDANMIVSAERPMVLRYLLVAHAQSYNEGATRMEAEAFAKRPPFQIGKRGTPHEQWEVWRSEAKGGEQ